MPAGGREALRPRGAGRAEGRPARRIALDPGTAEIILKSIAFVCGGAEPGSSGVGDYCLALASALRDGGVDARILAAADPMAGDSRLTSLRWAGSEVPVLRISPGVAPGESGARIGRWLSEFRPEWISVQMVPYAWDPKGLIGRSAVPWRLLADAARVHVMFHELWVGAYSGAPVKLRVWGWLQRRGLRRWMREMRAAVVHTSIPLYRSLLEDSGIDAGLLPMFGGVPIAAAGARAQGDFVAGIFGTLHPGFPAERVLPRLLAHAAALGRRLRVYSAGRVGAGAAEFDSWAARWPGAVFERIGPLDAAPLSRLLSGTDVGISSTPLNVIGKSSSAAAFAEHGVPVLCAVPGSPAGRHRMGPRDASPRAFLLDDYLGNRLDMTVARPKRGSGTAAAAAALAAALAAPRSGP